MHLTEQNKIWINAYASEFLRLWKLILYVEAQSGLMDRNLVALDIIVTVGNWRKWWK